MCSEPEPAPNLAQALELIDQAAAAGAELICLPENTLYLRVREGAPPPVHFPESRELDALRAAARAHRASVLLGSLTERSPDPARPYNTSVLLGPKGEVSATYRKLHLFRLPSAGLDESASTTPGEELVLARTPFGGLGLSICYDLRFPELYRALVARDATVLLAPAAFTRETGKDHWHTLLKARAIENQSFVVAPAQGGPHGGRRHSYGHALILGPWGEVLAEKPDEEPGVVVAELDPQALSAARARLPALADVRLEIDPG